MLKVHTFAALCVANVAAAITVDGTRDASYGPAVAVQTVNTGFGNATSPTGIGSGGELNAAYAAVEDGRLFVLLTGNIENNFNKLSVFFDSVDGGENTLSATPQYDFENISQNFGGLTFDAGFEADYHLYARWGSFTGNVFTVDIVERAGGASAVVRGNGDSSSSPDGSGAGTGIQSGIVDATDLGLGSTGVGEVRNLDTFLNAPLDFGFNNTNTGGVSGGTGAANQAAALAVTTGLEFSVALADLGVSALADEIRLHVAYGDSNHTFHSNQSLAGLPAGTGNLGGNNSGAFIGNLSGVDYSAFAGDQFFTIDLPDVTAGDFNGDGVVDAIDYTRWRQNFGLSEETLLGAGDGSGVVDGGDYDLWAQSFGSGASGFAIPEPAAMAWLALGMAFAHRGRRAIGTIG